MTKPEDVAISINKMSLIQVRLMQIVADLAESLNIDPTAFNSDSPPPINLQQCDLELIRTKVEEFVRILTIEDEKDGLFIRGYREAVTAFINSRKNAPGLKNAILQNGLFTVIRFFEGLVRTIYLESMQELGLQLSNNSVRNGMGIVETFLHDKKLETGSWLPSMSKSMCEFSDLLAKSIDDLNPASLASTTSKILKRKIFAFNLFKKSTESLCHTLVKLNELSSYIYCNYTLEGILNGYERALEVYEKNTKNNSFNLEKCIQALHCFNMYLSTLIEFNQINILPTLIKIFDFQTALFVSIPSILKECNSPELKEITIREKPALEIVNVFFSRSINVLLFIARYMDLTTLTFMESFAPKHLDTSENALTSEQQKLVADLKLCLKKLDMMCYSIDNKNYLLHVLEDIRSTNKTAISLGIPLGHPVRLELETDIEQLTLSIEAAQKILLAKSISPYDSPPDVTNQAASQTQAKSKNKAKNRKKRARQAELKKKKQCPQQMTLDQLEKNSVEEATSTDTIALPDIPQVAELTIEEPVTLLKEDKNDILLASTSENGSDAAGLPALSGPSTEPSALPEQPPIFRPIPESKTVFESSYGQPHATALFINTISSLFGYRKPDRIHELHQAIDDIDRPQDILLIENIFHDILRGFNLDMSLPININLAQTHVLMLLVLINSDSARLYMQNNQPLDSRKALKVELQRLTELLTCNNERLMYTNLALLDAPIKMQLIHDYCNFSAFLSQCQQRVLSTINSIEQQLESYQPAAECPIEYNLPTSNLWAQYRKETAIYDENASKFFAHPAKNLANIKDSHLYNMLCHIILVNHALQQKRDIMPFALDRLIAEFNRYNADLANHFNQATDSRHIASIRK